MRKLVPSASMLAERLSPVRRLRAGIGASRGRECGLTPEAATAALWLANVINRAHHGDARFQEIRYACEAPR